MTSLPRVLCCRLCPHVPVVCWPGPALVASAGLDLVCFIYSVGIIGVLNMQLRQSQGEIPLSGLSRKVPPGCEREWKSGWCLSHLYVDLSALAGY